MDFRQCKLNDGFWKRYEELDRDVTMNTVYEQFRDSGRVDAVRCDWREGQPHKPNVYWSGDVEKWTEGASYLLYRYDLPETERRVNEIVERYEEGQREDGYLNPYYIPCEPAEKRFTARNDHELYDAGHLMEAAVAHFYATGNDRLLRVARRYADLIDRLFRGCESERRFLSPGHPEIELALMRLYRATGETRYAELAKFFLDKRAANDVDEPLVGNVLHGLDNASVREMRSAVGHAVRCMYLLCGMADVAETFHDGALLESCRAVYEDVVGSKLYVTGGIGSNRIGEAFEQPYDLPNETAYAETCASIALMMFADRMCRIEKQAKYADTVERAMYNGMLSGISLQGDAFFYENPLEIDLRLYARDSVKRGEERRPITQRVHLFSVSCCPPNLVRTLASMATYAYHADGGDCYVNQFMDSAFDDGTMRVTQRTQYPNGNTVELACENVERLFVRIPSWCGAYDFSEPYTVCDGYAVFERPERTVVFTMDLSPKLIEASPQVHSASGRRAVQAGPIVYCAEAVDNGENLHALYLDARPRFAVSYDAFFGANTIVASGFRKTGGASLYSEASDAFEATEIKLIPYYGFANRGESDMLVWLNCRA